MLKGKEFIPTIEDEHLLASLSEYLLERTGHSQEVVVSCLKTILTENKMGIGFARKIAEDLIKCFSLPSTARQEIVDLIKNSSSI